MKIHKITTNGFSIVLRLATFLLIWWVLTDGMASSLWFGVPAILLALISSIVLIPPLNLIWYECVRFIPFFLKNSLIGGIDVAWRAFHPRLPIAPDLIEYSLKLPAGFSQVFMANTVNLLPGTLSAALENNILKVHVLDSQKDFLCELKAVEQHVAQIFGLSLNYSSTNNSSLDISSQDISSKGKSNETL